MVVFDGLKFDFRLGQHEDESDIDDEFEWEDLHDEELGRNSVVPARLQAVSQPKPSLIEPGPAQAHDSRRPDEGFGLGFNSGKLKPPAQAGALTNMFFPPSE